MLAASNRTRHRSTRSIGLSARKGAALVFVLVFVIAMAALAMSSIFMASNSNLLAKSYDRERDLKFAAEAALAIGKSRVNSDPTILNLRATQPDTAILDSAQVYDAAKKAIPGLRVSVWVGPTGSTSGQFGRFSSVVAKAWDERKNSYIRRLELTQESFAKFAYWSNDESNNGTTIFFNNGDELWGPVWSNDTISIGSGGATFHDDVSTAGIVVGKNYGTFVKGVFEKQKPIVLPSTTSLNALATVAGPYSMPVPPTPVTSNDETKVLNRIEFIATDLNANGDSLQSNEGFFRYYTAKAGNEKFLRGDWQGTAVANSVFCGDFHWATRDPADPITGIATQYQKFYPASVHGAPWFKADIKQGFIDQFGYSAAKADTLANNEVKLFTAGDLKSILSHTGSRCYLAGDPHLVAVDRSAANLDPTKGAGIFYPVGSMNKGGTDTTFTANGVYGAWKAYSALPNADTTYRSTRKWDGAYLHPIDRMFNNQVKGVIYVPANVGVSGTVNGKVTLYSKGSIIILDDLRYANDPVRGVCADILGMIADWDVVIADNALNDPPDIDQSASVAKYFSLDDSKDMFIHAVMMALKTSFRVENYGGGPKDANDCATATTVVNNGRGCIYLSGGIIQQARGAVGTSTGTGYTKRYSYDRCAVINPPPYFPTTGRFQDNRYLELDPVGFSDKAYFLSLTPSP